MSPKRRGFTLVELLIALALSSTVLIALMSVLASLLRSHVDTTLKGEVSGWTVLALDQLNREVEEATFIAAPAPKTSGNVLSGCTNFSRVLYDAVCTGSCPGEGRLDVNTAVTAFYYCRSTDIGGGMPGLVRKYAIGNALVCPDNIPAAPCTAGAHGPTSGADVIVRNFHFRDDDATLSPTIFANRGDGIEMHFAVGFMTRPTSGPGASIPVANNLKVDTFVRANKPYTYRPTDTGTTD
ncbi:MAG: prepilin-type N-terminal cleavage/methylation domain-containing protein [Elusimicrobia bacterium]|nr:prepilin-type N-terminal cleavage/methylation domain-containing protein [Elusimicrobiota bacterium]